MSVLDIQTYVSGVGGDCTLQRDSTIRIRDGSEKCEWRLQMASRSKRARMFRASYVKKERRASVMVMDL